MIALFFLIVGSVLIGIGTGSWWIGCGVAVITSTFLIHYNTTSTAIYNAIVKNLIQIYQKIG
jgi:hypothetical protein